MCPHCVTTDGTDALRMELTRERERRVRLERELLDQVVAQKKLSAELTTLKAVCVLRIRACAVCVFIYRGVPKFWTH